MSGSDGNGKLWLPYQFLSQDKVGSCFPWPMGLCCGTGTAPKSHHVTVPTSSHTAQALSLFWGEDKIPQPCQMLRRLPCISTTSLLIILKLLPWELLELRQKFERKPSARRWIAWKGNKSKWNLPFFPFFL